MSNHSLTEYTYEPIVALPRPLDLVQLDYEPGGVYRPVRVPVVGMAVSHRTYQANVWDRETGRLTNRKREAVERVVEYVIHHHTGPMHQPEYEELLGSDSYVIGVYEPGQWPSLDELEFAREELDIERRRAAEERAARRAKMADAS